MTLTKTYVGQNPDGSPHFSFVHDGDSDTGIVITGPVYGQIAVLDGKDLHTYDVSEPVIEAPLNHHGPLSCAIGKHHEEHGHPLHDDDHPFVHECSDHCEDSGGKAKVVMSLLGTTYSLQALDAGTGGATNVMGFTNLHTATTGTTGTNEMSGSTRQATSWNAASGTAPSCVKTNSAGVTYTTPGTTAATHVGTWSLVSSGVFGVGLVLGSSVTAVTVTAASGALSVGAS